MTLSELIERYVTFKRSLGLIYRSEAQVLQAFCRAIGDRNVVCVFHGSLPPSPQESCHPIHAKAATQSTGKLPPNPRQGCHPLQAQPAVIGATRRRA